MSFPGLKTFIITLGLIELVQSCVLCLQMKSGCTMPSNSLRYDERSKFPIMITLVISVSGFKCDIILY